MDYRKIAAPWPSRGGDFVLGDEIGSSRFARNSLVSCAPVPSPARVFVPGGPSRFVIEETLGRLRVLHVDSPAVSGVGGRNLATDRRAQPDIETDSARIYQKELGQLRWQKYA